MCVKNSMPYIMASVESFKSQNYKNKELVIIYSNSDDNTEYYLNSLKNDRNIKIYKFNGSIYECLNFGINRSKGKIIGILHSDDVYYKNDILKEISKKFKKNKLDIVFGNVLFSKKNNLLNIKRVWKNIQIKKRFDIPPHPSTFIKRSILIKNKFNTSYSISSDTDLLLRIFKDKYKFHYINKFFTIMRSGGISNRFEYLLKKSREDIKIFYSNNLNILHYTVKIISKIKQVIYTKNIKINRYNKKINKISKVKFINLNKFESLNGKIMSALNLAFLTYNYKYKLRTHNHQFWPDGFFSKLLTKKPKSPGRIFFLKLLKKLNNNNAKFQKYYVLGNLSKNSNNWLKEKLKEKYIHIKLPFGEIKKLVSFVKKKNIVNNSFIIITLPTPKQELVGNYLLKKLPKCSIICIGGSINILSGEEKETPDLFYFLNLEWLWRLKFDTKRRLKRLFESIYLLYKILIYRKIDIF